MLARWKTGVLRGLAVAAILVCGASAFAQQQAVKLFKVVTVKDEVEIGLSGEELQSFGAGPEIDVLARRLADAGQITVWQYAVRKAADGSMEHAPLKRIAIFRNDTLRIEPFNPAPLKIVPASK